MVNIKEKAILMITPMYGTSQIIEKDGVVAKLLNLDKASVKIIE